MVVAARMLHVLALACVTLAVPALAAKPGEPAPAFELTDAHGERIALSALRGRVVYVDFWASWCAPCRRSFPWMNALAARYKGEGLAIVGINVDKRREDAERFLGDTPAAFTIVYDAQGATPAAYAVAGMPSAYLVDRRGVVIDVEEGFHEARRADIEAKVRAALAQR
jgi:cytochrome c biogenesis protein CcmG/thiol:disulfide interchange protein DsbE